MSTASVVGKQPRSSKKTTAARGHKKGHSPTIESEHESVSHWKDWLLRLDSNQQPSG